MAIIKEINIKNHTTMKCVDCGREIPSYWYYKKKKEGVVIILT